MWDAEFQNVGFPAPVRFVRIKIRGGGGITTKNRAQN